MPFTYHSYRRFPVQCSVTYNTDSFLKLILVSYFTPHGFYE
jgi:hypothetical protein